MNYYKEITDIILDSEAYDRIKDYSKERNRVIAYFKIGKLLHQAGKHYGEGVIQKYADSLEKRFGKKYDKYSLYRMRQFYLLINDLNHQILITEYQKVATLDNQQSKSLYYKGDYTQKVATLNKDVLVNLISSFNLSWSHYKELLSISNPVEAYYYIKTVINNQLSVRQLRDRIKSKEYYRLDEKTRNKLISYEETTVIDYVKNPIMIKNKNNYDDISESVLQTLILENLPSFLKELGNGFSFIGNEYKIKLGDRNNYIDLLLFNYEYNCFVVVELKVTELKKEHIGQIELYMNYIDKNIKKPNHDKTIGIIICKKDNKFVIEYVSDNRITVREYKIIN